MGDDEDLRWRRYRFEMKAWAMMKTSAGDAIEMKAWAMTKTSLLEEAGDAFDTKAWAMTRRGWRRYRDEGVGDDEDLPP